MRGRTRRRRSKGCAPSGSPCTASISNAIRMEKRRSGKCGRADFRICHRGRWLSAECKAAGEPLSDVQEREAKRLRNSGGVFVVVRRLGDLVEALEGARWDASGGSWWPFHFGRRWPDIGEKPRKCASRGRSFALGAPWWPQMTRKKILCA
jgi:hypothetical protein